MHGLMTRCVLSTMVNLLTRPILSKAAATLSALDAHAGQHWLPDLSDILHKMDMLHSWPMLSSFRDANDLLQVPHVKDIGGA